MPNPGDIFIYKNFVFEDGSSKDKIFVILNDYDLDRPCLALKTTSNSKRYLGCNKGCNPGKKCFFAPSNWQSCFFKDTYIQLPQIFHFETNDLIQKWFTKEIDILSNSLSKDCFSQLKMCLAGYKEDISRIDWELIYSSKRA